VKSQMGRGKDFEILIDEVSVGPGSEGAQGQSESPEGDDEEGRIRNKDHW